MFGFGKPWQRDLLLAGALVALTANGSSAASPQSWEKVIPDGAKRFKILSQFNDEAVLDKETGLVWHRSPSSASSFDWGSSVTLCPGASIGGRRGWRLPSISELMTLKDPAQSNPALPPDHPFLGIVTGTIYWSATAAPDDADAAVSTTFSSGGQGVITTAKTSLGLRWCVRGPGGDQPGTP